MKLRLTDEDRARYGGPEWLDWDNTKLRRSELELLQQLFGIGLQEYRTTWLSSGDDVVIIWALWLSLRRSGVDVPWDGFDVDILGARYQNDPPVGKEPESIPPATSGSSGSDSPPP